MLLQKEPKLLDLVMIENNLDRFQGFAEAVFPIWFGRTPCFVRVLPYAGIYRREGYTMPSNDLDCSSKEEKVHCFVQYFEV